MKRKHLSLCQKYTFAPMQLVTPSVVAIAVAIETMS